MEKSTLTFKDVCDIVRKEDDSVIDDISILLGYNLLVTPLAFIDDISILISAFGLLGAKNEIITIVKRMIKKAKMLDEIDYAKRYKKMESVYVLICYTAFFDALEKQLSEIKKKQNLNNNFKITLLQTALEEYDSISQKRNSNSNFEKNNVPILNPSDGLTENLNNLNEFYQQLADILISHFERTNLLHGVSFNEKSNFQNKNSLRQLPDIACECFKEQYFYLCTEHHDFFFWTNIIENQALYKMFIDYSDSIAKMYQISIKIIDVIDVGFNELSDRLKNILPNIINNDIQQTLTEISNYYRYQINNPIILDEYSLNNQTEQIKFPRIKDIFITQSFKLLSYSHNMLIEDRDLWTAKKDYPDIGLFILNFLISPVSIRTPLIILGEPGSGKSLLTQMLASRRISTNFITIRIKLRDVNLNRPINQQIEQEIYRITKREINWAHFTSVKLIMI